MKNQSKLNQELLTELQELKQKYQSLKTSYEKSRIGVRLDEDMIIKLLKAVNITSDSIFLTDTEGIITYVNSGFTALYGYTADEVIGKLTPRIIKSRLLEKEVYENFWKTLKNKAEVKGEILNKRKNGELVLVESTSSPILDEQNAIIGFIGIQRDITERKKTEEKLLIINKVVDFTSDAIGISDAQGHHFYQNKALSDLFEYATAEELEAAGGGKAVVKDPDVAKEMFENIMGGKSWAGELTMVTKSGRVFPAYERADAIKDSEGNLHGLIGIVTDITERKKVVEQLIIAKEKAEEGDRLKSAFLANMSHEIRTPMNGILGFAELLNKPNLTGEERQNYISIIEKSGVRMLNIITDIVSISKIESGQMEVSISETNINEQIEYIYTFFKPEVERKGMQLLVKNALTSKESIIKTDRDKLYAILTNLVSNAIKFTQTGSIELGYEKKGKHIEFFVKDTGAGIHQEQKEIIFDRFKQGTNLTNRYNEGVGLGLSISKAYVEMLGGKIWVESELEKGSIFYFTIPYNAETQAKSVIEDVSLGIGTDNQINPEVSGLKILIAEDDDASEMFISMAVKMYGKEFLKAETGVEAVEACRKNPDIDLVLMDIRMPEMNGYEATRQIRKFNKDVVIIAQTAYALTGDREKAIEAGCNDYISKPIDPNLLKILIQKHFKK